MNYQILILVSIAQTIWWIIAAILLEPQLDIHLCVFATLCIIVRLLQIFIILRDVHKLYTIFIQLIFNIIYTEASLRTPLNNYLNNHSNTLLIILNYVESNQNKDKWSIIPRYAYPFYALTRMLSLAFINADYYILESTFILIIVFALLVQENLILKFSKKNTSNIDMAPKKLMTFNNEESKKASLANSFKKSRTHFSIQREAQDQLLCDNPIVFRKTDNQIKYTIESPVLRRKSKMKRSGKHQFSIISQQNDKTTTHQFYQNLLNTFPQGILILNHSQKIVYLNNKCEKLLECNSREEVINQLKCGLIEAQLPESSNSFVRMKQRNIMNQHLFEEIVKQYKSQKKDLDVFDLLLYPQKYINLYNNQSPYSEQEQASCDSFNGTHQLVSNVIVYDQILNNQKDGKDRDKKLKIIIFPSQMTPTQQELFQSQQRVQINTCNEGQQPILLFMIKNVTNKHKIEQLKQEKEIHNTLLKSFSHELRTPINSSQQALAIVRDVVTDPTLLNYINIAYISISLLTHQLNDILDYSAMQSNTFQYRLDIFPIVDIVHEISNMFQIQLESKKIKFMINIDEKLKNSSIRSDKRRIIQVLVNLLNNSCKFTKEHGEIKISIKQADLSSIKIKVKDNGIGITNDQLANLKKSLASKQSLKKSRIRKNVGLGISISARIVEGLSERQNNILHIFSNEQKGTTISFFVENQQETREDSVINPMYSEYTERRPTFKKSNTQMNQQDDENGPILRQMSDNSSSIKNNETLSKRGLLFNHNQNQNEGINDDLSISIKQVPQSPMYSFKQRFTVSDYHSQEFPCECRKVMIVDDVPFNQIALKALLLHNNVIPDQAYDGFQAINLVQKKQEQHCRYYDLIFMDIEMPGINGFQTTKEILNLTKSNTSIVMCSAYDTQENFQEGFEVGVVDFLPKPVNQRDLQRVLQKYLVRKN